MTQQDRQLTNYRGRVSGLMDMLEEARQRRNRLWVSTFPTPGHGRAEALALLTEMVTRNDQTPGCGQPQPMGRGLTVPRTNNSPSSLDPIRMWSRNPDSHLQVVDSPLRHTHFLAQVSG